ncbi:MAG: hypothetical protein ISS91_00520 [Candidatus Omnitrophica bacterium]|nr:hypothetical protein [Candidatus Omnitrophota bacterium]
MLDEILTIKSEKKHLREFGLTIGIILCFLGGIGLWRGKEIYPYFFTVGGIFIVTGVFIPFILKPLQKAWMGFSIILGFFVSRIIMTILFYFVLTPIGIIMRLLGKDLLDQKIDKNKVSYWHQRDAKQKDAKSYENQY